MRKVTVPLSRSRLAVSMILATILLSSCSAIHQAEFGYKMDRMIADARSPADHEAIAAAYDHEAEHNRQEASVHLKMAQSYEGRPDLKVDYSGVCRQMAKE